MKPTTEQIQNWFESPQIVQWIASRSPDLGKAILENLPELIANYNPQAKSDWTAKFVLSDGIQRAIGVNRQQWLLWTGTGIAVSPCDFSLQDYLNSLPIPTQDDLRKARLLAEQGFSRGQIYEVLDCNLSPEIEDAIALGHEQSHGKSLYRRAVEDHHFPSIVRILKRFGWRTAG
ncbi:hypothetical protein NIES2135_05020 [Leptolyngbya boryana NIES-2135]|jgi:hypothetical protein|uniref:Uncharacterized protein n=1 Tax=Leptolyngbya boryana NIES-2135 TaxID=1973484 RepID=A0A1Z4JAB5_LEPBY|nr:MULTISPECIES: hypothetical protein [Leptolyngbya]BAY53692.1 hypothetical protein NIES2135_05020 [Leptolyngbya boryana NIES-2135]MBD2367869.1 hypothetical protein [Leptolyngbya sp. FACHB-161]MBD2374283.1 hypothetical protein [Leptolyngbya sp. FACHB-238]MBD2398505.1 hypothetical protein [Leptolyngbya sp. FACHB-239]MBD2408319.1 hypothetical protein [Leptolyngbya sp. FACHB-402]